MQVVDASKGIELLCADEHHHDHDHHHEEEETEYNAHIWLDPKNAIQMVKNMEAQLSALLPEHGKKMAENAENYILRLENLDARLSDALTNAKQRDIVTFHDSFPYFAKAYDLHVVAVVSMEPEEPLSPRMLTEVIDQVTAAGNPPLFAEPQYRNAALEAISRETGAPVYRLDPVVTGNGSPTAYEDAMEQNLNILLSALGE